MGWMLALGDEGMTGTYVPPAGAVIEGSSIVCEVDLFHKKIHLCLNCTFQKLTS